MVMLFIGKNNLKSETKKLQTWKQFYYLYE